MAEYMNNENKAAHLNAEIGPPGRIQCRAFGNWGNGLAGHPLIRIDPPEVRKHARGAARRLSAGAGRAGERAEREAGEQECASTHAHLNSSLNGTSIPKKVWMLSAAISRGSKSE